MIPVSMRADNAFDDAQSSISLERIRFGACVEQDRMAGFATVRSVLQHRYLPAPIRWSGNHVAIWGKKHKMTIADIIHKT
jgi:hypothetical protein